MSKIKLPITAEFEEIHSSRNGKELVALVAADGAPILVIDGDGRKYVWITIEPEHLTFILKAVNNHERFLTAMRELITGVDCGEIRDREWFGIEPKEIETIRALLTELDKEQPR